jgi:hypothetical protein
MQHLRNIIDLPTPQRSGELFRHGLAARSLLERAWDSSTAYQGITLQLDDPASRGQCGVSSLWLAQYLEAQGLNALFTEGAIHLRDNAGDDHVWVEVQDIASEPLVLDITSDQYGSVLGTPVHLGTYSDSTETIGHYTVVDQFRPHEVPRKKLLARFALLQERITHVPRKYQLDIK